MTDLVVLRHASTLWNEERRYQGKTDIPLSETGRNFLKARKVPEQFLKFEKFSSPLSRATQTAELLNLSPFSLERRLAESDCGTWEGRTIDEIKPEIDYSKLNDGWGGTDFKPHGGESIADLQRRLRPWLLERAKLNQPTLAICHKGIIMAMMGLAMKWDMTGPPPKKIDYQTLQWFKINELGELTIEHINIPYEMRTP